MSDTEHTFTRSGLGLAPFRFLGMFERTHRAGDHVQAGGTCDHCGTGIRYCFQVQSADGVVSEVGSDCIMKAGDRGLRKVVNAEKNRKAREKREAVRVANWTAKLDGQRAKYGGMTWNELQDRLHEEDRAWALIMARPLIEKLAPLADRLADGKGGFRDSVAQGLREGNVPASERALEIIADILGKQEGRGGSKAYWTEYARVHNFIDDILSTQ